MSPDAVRDPPTTSSHSSCFRTECSSGSIASSFPLSNSSSPSLPSRSASSWFPRFSIRPRMSDWLVSCSGIARSSCSGYRQRGTRYEVSLTLRHPCSPADLFRRYRSAAFGRDPSLYEDYSSRSPCWTFFAVTMSTSNFTSATIHPPSPALSSSKAEVSASSTRLQQTSSSTSAPQSRTIRVSWVGLAHGELSLTFSSLQPLLSISPSALSSDLQNPLALLLLHSPTSLATS